MKKVLIITNHSYMLYRFRLDLIRRLAQAYEVVLSMPFVGHEADFQSMGLRCIETKLNRRGINLLEDFHLFRTYLRLLRTERPDMVITYSIKPNIYAGMACRMLGIPYCGNVQGLGTAFQGGALTCAVSALYRVAFRGVKTVFFENRSNADVFRDRRILHQDKQVILPGAGINLERFPLAAYPEHDRFHFLYLGRIMEEKGITELLEAYDRLEQALPGQVFLDIVGFYEDDFRPRIDALVQEGRVCFHGFQAEPRPFYRDADCVVMPSYHEGMSNVLLEAAALGRPVITCDIPGCREAVDDGVTGLLCRVKDADSLYEQMYRMATLPRAQREKMGIAGHEKMRRQFEKHMVVEQTVSAIFAPVEPGKNRQYSGV